MEIVWGTMCVSAQPSLIHICSPLVPDLNSERGRFLAVTSRGKTVTEVCCVFVHHTPQ